MLFESCSLREVAGHQHLEQRGALLQLIILDFRKTFPTIDFELHAESQTINAQAIIHGDTRIVRLYGGLAFHPLAENDLLVFALLHEVGHQLSSGGRLAFCESLGCECAADRWVLEKGASALKKHAGRALDLKKAISSLDALEATAGYGRTAPLDNKVCPPRCWALSWRKRRAHLVGQTPMPIVRRCGLSEFFVRQSFKQMESKNGFINAGRRRSRR